MSSTETPAITWNRHDGLNGYISYVELNCKLSFESGYSGTVRIWAELYLGDAGEREIRCWVLGQTADFVGECAGSREELNDCVLAALPSDVFEWPLATEDRAILNTRADDDVCALMETEFSFDAKETQVAS